MKAKVFFLCAISMFLGLLLGYGIGGYYINLKNYSDNTSVQVDVSFIRVKTALDTLNSLRSSRYSKSIEIQEGLMCAIVKNINSSNVELHLKDKFNSKVKEDVNKYRTLYLSMDCTIQ